MDIADTFRELKQLLETATNYTGHAPGWYARNLDDILRRHGLKNPPEGLFQCPDGVTGMAVVNDPERLLDWIESCAVYSAEDMAWLRAKFTLRLLEE